MPSKASYPDNSPLTAAQLVQEFKDRTPRLESVVEFRQKHTDLSPEEKLKLRDYPEEIDHAIVDDRLASADEFNLDAFDESPLKQLAEKNGVGAFQRALYKAEVPTEQHNSLRGYPADPEDKIRFINTLNSTNALLEDPQDEYYLEHVACPLRAEGLERKFIEGASLSNMAMDKFHSAVLASPLADNVPDFCRPAYADELTDRYSKTLQEEIGVKQTEISTKQKIISQTLMPSVLPNAKEVVSAAKDLVGLFGANDIYEGKDFDFRIDGESVEISTKNGDPILCDGSVNMGISPGDLSKLKNIPKCVDSAKQRLSEEIASKSQAKQITA